MSDSEVAGEFRVLLKDDRELCCRRTLRKAGDLVSLEKKQILDDRRQLGKPIPEILGIHAMPESSVASRRSTSAPGRLDASCEPICHSTKLWQRRLVPARERKAAPSKGGRGTSAKSEDTREKIVQAALEAFATHGFDGASTRQIAALAGENQGLISYYFATKENLWKAAVDSVFLDFRRELEDRADVLADADIRTRIRLLIIYLVRHAARRPEQMQLMIQEGKADSPRMQWLVDTHIKGPFAMVAATLREAIDAGVVPEAPVVHYFYMLVGACSLFFNSGPEVRRLTGDDPFDPAMIEAHAEALVRLVLR